MAWAIVTLLAMCFLALVVMIVQLNDLFARLGHLGSLLTSVLVKLEALKPRP